jgi:hypothetical protein
MKILALATTKVRTVRSPFGGREFKREMYNAASQWIEEGHEVRCIEIEETKPKDIWWTAADAISQEKHIDCLAVFGHGTPKWIHGIGINYWTVGRLVLYLAVKSTKLILLYSCSCGRSKGEWALPFRWRMFPKKRKVGEVSKSDGIAMVLADEMAKNSQRVDVICHATYGHTTMNPYYYKITTKLENLVFRFPVIDRLVGKEAKMDKPLVALWKRWCKALKKTNLRFLFPFMKDTEIIKQLDRGSNDILSRDETK